MKHQYMSKNESFFNISDNITQNYQEEDISMYLPILLYDESLEKIKDVFDIDIKIDEDTRFRIINECKTNIWYFFREFARLTNKTQILNDRHLVNRFRFTLTEKAYKMIWAYNMGYNFLVSAENDNFIIRDTLSLIAFHYNYFIKSKIKIDYQHSDFIPYLFSQIILMYDYIRSQNVDEIYSEFLENRKMILGSDNDFYILEKISSENVKNTTDSQLNIFFDIDNLNTMISHLINRVDLNDNQKVIGFILSNENTYTNEQEWIINNTFINIKDDHKFEFLKKYGSKSENERFIRKRNMIFYI